ncbi:MAG: hypothetical protein IKE91_03075 [Clostridia bacterium]|nr:hypothetical protein [Clostridia bacterium]
MFRIILLVLVCITIAYWIGYRAGISASNFRPVIFLTFGKHDPKDKQSVSEIYWGYFERPYSNRNNFVYFAASVNGKNVYFLVERDALIEEAKGQQVVATINVGNYTRRKNAYYLAYLFHHGKHILLEPENTEYENPVDPKKEEPGA